MTRTTIPACAGNPFDTDSISNFQTGGFTVGAELDNFANTLVASYLAGLSWIGKHVPLQIFSTFKHRVT